MIGNLSASLDRTSDRGVALQNKRLRRLVSHAYENVAFYRGIFDEARVAPRDIRTVSDLLAIPITSREDVRDSAVKDVVARHADPRRLLTWNTSGSSGMPLDIRRTWLEERTLNMVRFRAYREIGLRARDRIALIRRPRPTGLNDHQWLHWALQSLGVYRQFPISCFDTGDEIARKLADTKPDVIFGSPGVVSLVAQHIDSKIRRHVQPRFIGVGGEVLTPSMREQICECFGAPVFDTYASYEFNLMAWECADSGRMHVCDDSVIVEVIKDGRPVAPGERGEVVATALHSFAMPFIRYRLGDIVTRGEAACPCGAPCSTIMEIQGRVIDHFVLPDGRVVNPYAVTGPLKRSAPWIKQFQLTQESEDQFIFRVVPATRPSRQDLASLAICAEAIVGPEVRFETRLVPEIPLEVSGKFRVCRSFASVPHGSVERSSGNRAMDIHDRFDIRAQSYSRARVDLFNQANRRHPEARATERELLIDRLKLERGLTICDVGAGGGYLVEGIDAALSGECRIICVENSRSFLDSIDDRFDKVLSSLCRIDLPDAAVDRVSCLAGLHHQERKGEFFGEAYRILRPGGRVVVGDVLDGSPPAKFLNISVDRYTEIGHDGKFLRPGDLTRLMTETGFDDANEKYEQFTWEFPDWETMTWFCHTLFRMGKATSQQVEEEIDRYLQVTESPAGVHLHWSLIYATGNKST